MLSKCNFALLALLGATTIMPAHAGLSQHYEKSIKKVDQAWWKFQRYERNKKLERYIKSNQEEYNAFRSQSPGLVGIPVVIFRLLPEVFPDIFGEPEDKFKHVGLGRDLMNPDNVLPRGHGFLPSGQGYNFVQLTCSSCHSGSVTIKGKEHYLPGAPSSTFDFAGYRMLFSKAMALDTFNAEVFREKLQEKVAEYGTGWLYGNDPEYSEQADRDYAIFMSQGVAETMVETLKAGSAETRMKLATTLYSYTYSSVPGVPAPNFAPFKEDAPDPFAGNPGRMDAMGGYGSLATFGVAVNNFCFPPESVSACLASGRLTAGIAQIAADFLPPEPAISDHMPIWEQAGRSSSKWGGDVVDATHANVFAALGVTGSPEAVNIDVVNKVTAFSKDLPASAYPFNVSFHKMIRGKKLYRQHCASCHAYGNDNLVPAEEVGTDPNRLNVFNENTVVALRALVRVGCSDEVTCTDANQNPLPDEDVFRLNKGYAAVPLDGIWARAPYLHNGSVPNLRALLVPELRPATFIRGNTTYNKRDVGFKTDAIDGSSANAKIYDTTLLGNSNAGHSSRLYTGGLTDKKDINALLEYLKTL